MRIRAMAITATLITSIFNWISTPSIFADEETNPSQQTDKSSVTVEHSDSYWKSKLDPQTYQVTRCSATEPPFSGKYWNNHRNGTYVCSNCGAILFESKDKFDSGTGWPSFTKAQADSVKLRQDFSMDMERNEVICKRCGAHLGHVFEDGPTLSGERYCINSAALNFENSKQSKNGDKKP